MDRRKVNATLGVITYEKEKIFLSRALGGWSVGLKLLQEGLIEVWFSTVLLGHLDPQRAAFEGTPCGRTKAEEPLTAGGAS
jgi:hypothetical protein